jgi:hypothetical protein
MNDLTKKLALSAAALAMSLSLPGCGDSPSSPSGEAHSANDGHDHSTGSDSHDGHDHADGEHDEHDDHGHGDMRSLGSVTIGGTTMAVSVSSGIGPDTQVHLDLEVESGPIPAAVRFWIGDEAATGAPKARADAHGDHFHAHAEAPSNLEGAALWIEVETDDGTRTAVSLPLQG